MDSMYRARASTWSVWEIFGEKIGIFKICLPACQRRSRPKISYLSRFQAFLVSHFFSFLYTSPTRITRTSVSSNQIMTNTELATWIRKALINHCCAVNSRPTWWTVTNPTATIIKNRLIDTLATVFTRLTRTFINISIASQPVLSNRTFTSAVCSKIWVQLRNLVIFEDF